MSTKNPESQSPNPNFTRKAYRICKDFDPDTYYDLVKDYFKVEETSDNGFIFYINIDKADEKIDTCLGGKTPRDARESQTIKSIHDFLIKEKSDEALNTLIINQDIFPKIFPIFSAYHNLYSAVAYNKGIIVLTGAGNGVVPTYFFGYLYPKDNELILEEIKIDDFFQDTEFKNYENLLPTDKNYDNKKSMDILKQIENQYSEELKQMQFSNPNIQDRFKQFLEKIKNY